MKPSPYFEAAFWFALSAIAIAVGSIMCGCSGNVAPSLPANCTERPDYTCPLCDVHSCPGGWAPTDGRFYPCRANDSPSFPHLDCYRAQMGAVVGCECSP